MHVNQTTTTTWKSWLSTPTQDSLTIVDIWRWWIWSKPLQHNTTCYAQLHNITHMLCAFAIYFSSTSWHLLKHDCYLLFFNHLTSLDINDNNANSFCVFFVILMVVLYFTLLIVWEKVIGFWGLVKIILLWEYFLSMNLLFWILRERYFFSFYFRWSWTLFLQFVILYIDFIYVFVSYFTFFKYAITYAILLHVCASMRNKCTNLFYICANMCYICYFMLYMHYFVLYMHYFILYMLYFMLYMCFFIFLDYFWSSSWFV